MAIPYVGEIILVPYFRGAPEGYLPCDGQLLPINDYELLFLLIGTTYGGDGSTDFALPDLRGRVPVHQGQGPGRSPYALGQQFGQEQVTLTPAQLPTHSHPLPVSSAVASSTSPVGATLAVLPQDTAYAAGGSDSARSGLALTGGSQPHENRSPALGVLYVIAVNGIYPPQPS